MRKELPVLEVGFTAPPGVRIHHGSSSDSLGFHFLGIRTPRGFLFLQVRSHPLTARPRPAGDRPGPHRTRRAKLRRYSQVLRQALAAASQRALRRQARLRREQLLD